MNQIMIHEKLYITPELKRKKKLYKIDFFISIFLLCLLVSYYIYGEYDRYKGEQKSQDILDSMVIADSSKTYIYDDTTVRVDDEGLTIIIDSDRDNDDDDEDNENRSRNSNTTRVNTSILEEATIQERRDAIMNNVEVSEDGTEYYKIGIVNIPEINLSYPILSQCTDELLKISPCKFWGPDPNEVGNFCVVAHNYRNNKFFSKVPELSNGSEIEIVDTTGRKVKYIVYDKFVVSDEENECTSQRTNGKREVTLITCTNDSRNRVIVKAREKA
ncbi:MAG: sortase [Clostridia bacterium]|nr:sortase [Clostridia bacterium]